MKNYTITVNGNVYDVVVEEGASTGAPVARAAAPKAAPVIILVISTSSNIYFKVCLAASVAYPFP